MCICLLSPNMQAHSFTLLTKEIISNFIVRRIPWVCLYKIYLIWYYSAGLDGILCWISAKTIQILNNSVKCGYCSIQNTSTFLLGVFVTPEWTILTKISFDSIVVFRFMMKKNRFIFRNLLKRFVQISESFI